MCSAGIIKENKHTNFLFCVEKLQLKYNVKAVKDIKEDIVLKGVFPVF